MTALTQPSYAARIQILVCCRTFTTFNTAPKG